MCKINKTEENLVLWSTLFRRIGKTPLRISQHQHVTAVIDGEIIYLDLKYQADGKPYLVKAPEPVTPRKFKKHEQVRHINGWAGKIAATTPDPEHYYVVNLDEFSGKPVLINAKYLRKIND